MFHLIEQNMKNNLIFRTEPCFKDRDRIREIIHTTGVFHPYEVDVAIELIDAGMTEWGKKEYFFIFADKGSETTGYICYGPIRMTRDRYDIYWIAVRKNLHGMGIGSLLLNRGEKHIRELGGESIFVETSSKDSYKRARDFYIKHSYREVARVPDYFAQDDDKVIFMKSLS